MNTGEIKALLERYYEGETSLEEEKVLRDFFLSGNVPDELDAHKDQFLYFSEALTDEPGGQFQESEIFGKTEDPKVNPIHSARRRFYYISSIAAIALLLIGMLFIFRDKLSVNPAIENNSQAEVAFMQTRDILAVVSVNFNKGMDKVHYLGKLDQAMGKMQMLSKYYEYQSIIINQDPYENGSLKTIK